MMETRVMMIPLLIPIVLLGLLLVGLVVAIAVSDRRGPPAAHPRPSPPVAPPMQREGRLDILQRLADRRITVAEAEQHLLALGEPVPPAMPPPPPASTGVSGRGCLFTAILFFLAVCLALVLLFMLMGGIRVASHQSRYDRMHAVAERPVAVTRFTGPDPSSPVDAEITQETFEHWEQVEPSSKEESP